MIKAIINGVMSLIISLVGIILSPINLLINQFMPNLSTAFSTINQFFDTIGGVIPWVLSYFGISQELLTVAIDLIASFIA